jgi:hypothetical protein
MKYINTILMIGLAIAAGAAIYFIFQEIQQHKQKIEALSQHMRRLESLVWTYNIRPQDTLPIAEQTETDVSDDEGGYVENEEEGGGVESDDTGDLMMPGGMLGVEPPALFSVFSFSSSSNSGPVRPSQQDEAPQIEVVEEEQDIPEVVSFDTNRIAGTVTQSSTIVTIEDEQEVPGDVEVNEIQEEETIPDCESVPELDVPDLKHDDEKHDGDETKPGNRVYADTAKNRRLGRVGKPY